MTSDQGAGGQDAGGEEGTGVGPPGAGVLPEDPRAPDVPSGDAAGPMSGRSQADRPDPVPPILVPPVLLSDPGVQAAPARVTVERSMLTPQARVAALEGTVVLAVLVRSDGSVGDVRVRTTSGDQTLDAAAVHAAGAWRFTPATRDGVATEAWAIIPVRFVVEGK